MGIAWLSEEETDLLSTLPPGAYLRQEHYDTFVSQNPGINSRRSYASWRHKARILRSEHTTVELDAKFEEQVWLERREIILRENKRLQAQNRQLKATNELIIEATKDAMVKLPSFILPEVHVIKDRKRKPQVIMLDISDIHGGEIVRPEDVAGLAHYNFDICKEQMDTLTEGVLSICDSQQLGGIPLPKLVINFLGDCVTNEDIYIGQGRDIDRILVDQIVQLASELSRRVLYPLCQYFPEVVANAVWGNHGRLGRKGQYHQRTNADYLLYHFMRQTMSHVENFRMRISLSNFMGYVLPEDPERPHLLAHGDAVRSYMMIPWYGLSRWEARMVALTQVPWGFTHLGHHHQAASIDGPHGERIMNGSWPGGSDFSINQLQVGNQPKQTLLGLHPEHGRTFQYSIYLQKARPKLTVGEDGLYTPVWQEEVETKLR